MQDVMLKLESIRDDQRDKYWNHLQGRLRMGAAERKGSQGLMDQRPFVKEVVAVDRVGRPVKRPLAGKKCYLDAAGSGARGVYYWFTLRHGCCYLIQEQVSRTRTRRYYAIAANGALQEIGEREAVAFVASTRVVARNAS